MSIIFHIECIFTPLIRGKSFSSWRPEESPLQKYGFNLYSLAGYHALSGKCCSLTTKEATFVVTWAKMTDSKSLSSMRSCTSCTTAIEMNGNSNGLFSPGITVYSLHFVSSKWTSSVHQFFISICQSLSLNAYILPEEGLFSQIKQWGVLMGWAGTFQMSAQAFFNFLTKLQSFEVWTWASFGWLKVKTQCWICAGRKMKWEIDSQTRIIISTSYTRKEKGSGEEKSIHYLCVLIQPNGALVELETLWYSLFISRRSNNIPSHE